MKFCLALLTAFCGAAMATSNDEISLNVHLEGTANDDDCSPAEKFFLTNSLMTPAAEAVVIQHGFSIYGFMEQRSHAYVAPQRRELGLVDAAKESLGLGATQHDRELYVSYETCLRTCPILYPLCIQVYRCDRYGFRRRRELRSLQTTQETQITNEILTAVNQAIATGFNAGNGISQVCVDAVNAATVGVDFEIVDTQCAKDSFLGECTTTSGCQGMYSGATDCWNGGGGVCYCGTEVCGCGSPPAQGGTCGVDNFQGECSTTGGCRGMYSGAYDCKNSEGGVCFCDGGVVCGCRDR